MANLNTNEKQVLEKLFQMGSGYVLNFSDRTMDEYFKDDIGVNIFDQKYNYASGSKANRIRGFWQVEDDAMVGKSIKKLIEYIENQILLGHYRSVDFPRELLSRGKNIADRLSGARSVTGDVNEDEFVNRDFKNVSIDKLGLNTVVSAVLQQRLDEINRCINAKASLAVIFLCGSTLEGVLLGIATNRVKEFNQAATSPKDKTGKVKPFPDWKLNDFINVARELGLIGEDVKKFSHALRDFRNYIHPFQQISSGFNPDQHTAKICSQVLLAAITQLSS